MNGLFKKVTRPVFGVAMSALLSSGCVVVPYSVTPVIEVTESVEIEEDALVSVGPRRFLDKLMEMIGKKDARIEFVDGLTFRDTAFPDGGWRQTDLLEPTVAARAVASLDIRLAVLVGQRPTGTLSEETDLMVPALGGYYSGRETSVLDAIIIDLETATVVNRITAEASGRGRIVGYTIVFAGTVPRTEAAVIDGIVDSITETIQRHITDDRIRVTLLAAERSEAAIHEAAMRRKNEALTDL